MQIRSAAVIAVACIGGAADAQSARPADVSELSDCADYLGAEMSAADTVDRCSDILYHACLGNGASPTALDYEACQQRKHLAWDALLNAWWSPLRDAAKARGTWEALLAEQRQWIADRDARCDSVYRENGSGSIRNIAYLDCMGTVTALRAMEFHAALR